MSRLRLLIALVTALFTSSLLNAQVAGRLSGSVLDQTGASFPAPQ